MSPLNPDLEAKYRLILANAANELTVGESLPIDIERVCTKLQVEHGRNILDYKTARLAGKSRISLPSLLLPQSGYYSETERYLIAHEIGHFVLALLCSATPLGRSEYWQFEDLCNSFARQLLIPESTLNNLPNSITSPKEALVLASNLASNAFVPWPTAAWRVAERNTRFALLNVTARRDRLGQLVMKITASTLPRKQLQQKVLDTQAGLGGMLRPLTQGKDSISFCQVEAERAEIMIELPALGNVMGAYGTRSSRGGIHVAFHLKQ